MAQSVAQQMYEQSLAQQQQVMVKPQPKPPAMSRLTMVWNRTQDYVKARDYESAYRLILKEGDDMYLLRLVV